MNCIITRPLRCAISIITSVTSIFSSLVSAFPKRFDVVIDREVEIVASLVELLARRNQEILELIDAIAELDW